MRVERETVVNVILDDGTILKTGDKCVFLVNNTMPCIGVFKGVTKRGSLTFLANINDTYYEFRVMPSSIGEVEVIK